MHTQARSRTKISPLPGGPIQRPLLPSSSRVRVRQALRGVQAKLAVSQPGDALEQEADRVADQVLQMPESELPAACAGEEGRPERGLERGKDAGRPVQAKTEADPAEATPESPSGMDTQNGQPLPEGERTFFETRLGVDFNKVRIHTDSNAAQINKRLGARALTYGRDIYFSTGMYDPGSNNGKRLLAHELTHVVQQAGGRAGQRANLGQQIARAPERTIQRAIQNVQQAELVTFFSQPEQLLPQSLLDKYLIDSALMTTQRGIIRTLVDRVQRGEAPLSASELQALVLRRESDPGTALILCHNITKALARGTSPINWVNVSRTPLVYSLDGTTYTFDPANFHRDAYAFGSRGQESVFYAMLSGDAFGLRDEGDWYHYFALAATSYYAASRNLRPDSPSQDPTTRSTGELVRRVADALRDSSVTSSPAYEGWLTANAMSFLEGGFYGQTQAEVNAESNIHIQGASRGLAAVGRIPEENWQWYVPRVHGITIRDLSSFSLRPDMIAAIRAGIDGNFTVTIISGTTPDHWYDTPDPFVKVPGFFGSRTTTKDDTTTPVWNEVLTTLPYARLSSVTLELYDEDPVADDLITSFIDDLRPQGQRSRRFSLTSGGSTLEVRVEAAGSIVLASP